MILDTIMFVGYANEVDILEFRLNEYYDIVDKFLIIEGTHTFQGDPKPLHFKEKYSKEERFKKYLNKIEMVTFQSLAKGEEDKIPQDFRPNYSDLISSWNDHQQRRLITDVCIDWGMNKNDIVIIADCDEIYDKEYLKLLLNESLPCAGYLHISSYYINVWRTSPWGGGYIMNFDSSFDLENTRHNRDHRYLNFPLGLTKAGWHIAWLGDAKQLAVKIKSGGHTEINHYAEDIKKLNKSIKNLEWFESEEKFIINNDIVPSFFKQEKYKHLFYDG